MTDIKITPTSDRIILCAPYHPDLPPAARNLGGKWDASKKIWSFDLRDRERVMALARQVYGTDGTETVTDICTLRVTLPANTTWYARCGAIFLAGRQVARAYSRDGGAKLGDGVVILQGFARSGGSRANWETQIPGPAEIEIRDVPRVLANATVEQGLGNALSARYGSGDDAKVEIVDEELRENVLSFPR